MSNADRIRNMTVEELADFLLEVSEDHGWIFSDEYAEWQEWLESESD